MSIIFFIQFFFSVVIGIYFLNMVKSQQGNRTAIERESKKQMEKLRRLSSISLTKPLSEKTRPETLDDVVGQGNGLKALRAALCGPNPQHVIIYGPPGVGKTAAARVVLEEAKRSTLSPFSKEAKFIEIDATTLRFDERGIADPLIGSVHDPIYQGAGAHGVAGIPQPKPGAVTKAHGGILFIDEIGELHPIQMNRLLKVLEDRRVFYESMYYSSEDTNIPLYIHEIFKKGHPADFRLIGATTRSPEEIPPALRSRCTEVHFRALFPDEIKKIAYNASYKGGVPTDESVANIISRYAQNGRDAVNIVQMAGGIAQVEGRRTITQKDVEWVIEFGQYSPRIENKVLDGEQIGCVKGLAVTGGTFGRLIDIEVTVVKTQAGSGTVKITGVIDEEEINGRGQKLRRTGTAKSSVDNVLTVLNKFFALDYRNYDIHLNFPGGIPIDGPSAGVAIMVAIYSAITELPVKNYFAMTGEVSIHGRVKPVGGVVSKIEAAKIAGIRRIIIPKDNWQDLFETCEIEVISVDNVKQVIDIVFNPDMEVNDLTDYNTAVANILTFPG